MQYKFNILCPQFIEYSICRGGVCYVQNRLAVIALTYGLDVCSHLNEC